MSKDKVDEVINNGETTTLIIGNGVNRYSNNNNSSWENLLLEMAKRQNVRIKLDELEEMSNAKMYDILDLARPREDRRNLQSMFCDLMKDWSHGQQHTVLMRWAERHDSPVITVNFDENLSKSVDANFRLSCGTSDEPRFTDQYPWRSYFSTKEISGSIWLTYHASLAIFSLTTGELNHGNAESRSHQADLSRRGQGA
jgi:hypothetical protein